MLDDEELESQAHIDGWNASCRNAAFETGRTKTDVGRAETLRWIRSQGRDLPKELGE